MRLPLHLLPQPSSAKVAAEPPTSAVDDTKTASKGALLAALLASDVERKDQPKRDERRTSPQADASQGVPFLPLPLPLRDPLAPPTSLGRGDGDGASSGDRDGAAAAHQAGIAAATAALPDVLGSATGDAADAGKQAPPAVPVPVASAGAFAIEPLDAGGVGAPKPHAAERSGAAQTTE